MFQDQQGFLSAHMMQINVLASSKSSGSSLASFSRATSAMGPNITTGLRKPAAEENSHFYDAAFVSV